MNHEYISYIIKLNGIYDILCAISILKWVSIPYIKDLHLSMIKEKQNIILERFFAYWIFTYGIIRLSNNYLLITYSYLIEAFVFAYEYYQGTVYQEKTIFVIITSLLFAYLTYQSIQ